MNLYKPFKSKIIDIIDESSDTKTYVLEVSDRKFSYQSGQFVEVSVPGCGEAPISITSSPLEDKLELSIRKVGKLTTYLHDHYKKSDFLYIRGPYGNNFNIEVAQGKNIIFVAGGCGLAPVRSVIKTIFMRREKFGDIHILYGSRSVEDLLFKYDLDKWKKTNGVEVLKSVDTQPSEFCSDINVGVVTTLFDKIKKDLSDCVAYVCGPPIMIKFVIRKLVDLGLKKEHIITTLERYMKCGLGKCGHCNFGGKYICVHGPVFTLKEIEEDEDLKAEIFG